MDYSIISVDIGDKSLLPRVNSLLSDTFGYNVASDKLEKSTKTNSPKESLYLAAIHGDEIIGFNAFISHDLIFNGSKINAYQSCWTATSNAHRGKKIFQNLINTAKETLRSRDAAFIFGFPNANSQPLFTKKLGFREIQSLKWQVPNISFVRDLYIKIPGGDVSVFEKNSILQNDRQLIEIKTREYQDDLIVAELNKSLIWGVGRSTKKLGVNLRYFEIGGIYLADPADVKSLFQSLCIKVKKTHYFQLTASAAGPYLEIFNNLKPAQTNDLIVFDLCFDTAHDVRFNLFGGVKDVF